jgi:hypothetical protein
MLIIVLLRLLWQALLRGILNKELFIMIMKRKAQSFLDYTALIVIVCISLMAMWGYIFRSINARVAHVWADLYHPQTGVR